MNSLSSSSAMEMAEAIVCGRDESEVLTLRDRYDGVDVLERAVEARESLGLAIVLANPPSLNTHGCKSSKQPCW